MAEVDGDTKPRAGARETRPRRLRDISHLYLTQEPRAATPAARTPVPRRALRLGFAANGDRLAKTDVCGNMAVQLARLGQRTLVLDLDPALPNAGFQLGLEPSAYMAHLRSGARPRLERGLLGLRVLEGVASDPKLNLDDALRAEIQAADCVLVNLPSADAAAAIVQRLDALLLAPVRPVRTTMARVGERSRMFGEWLQGARADSNAPGAERRPAARQQAGPLDTLLFVHGASTPERVTENVASFGAFTSPGRVRIVAWGDAASNLEPQPWACIRSYPLRMALRQPLSSVYPEHPAARMYQNLAQSLLAGSGSAGGPRV